jgi:topoisomerase-4 subunit A
MTRDGYLKRSSLKSVMATNGEVGLKANDCILKQLEINTKETILIFTNLGNYINLPVYKIPDKKWKEIGEYIGAIAPLSEEESVIDFLVIDEFDDRKILLATDEGLIKLVNLSEFQPARITKTYSCIPASKLHPLVAADLTYDYDTAIVVATENGYVLKYQIAEVPVLSTTARGVKAINLREDKLIGACNVTDIAKDEVLFLTNRGGLKREFVSAIELGHRPAKGKLYLKSVKTNPYKLVGIVSANVFRLKEHLSLRIITDKTGMTIPVVDLKPDKYENGIPILEKDISPLRLLLDELDKAAIDLILTKLARDKQQNRDLAEEETEIEGEPSPLPEPKPEPELDAMDVMNELEKIININNNPSLDHEDEKESDEEIIIQQTLF